MNDPITHDQDAQARATMGATERACPEMVVPPLIRATDALASGTDLMRKASAEIDRLRAENERMGRALRAIIAHRSGVFDDPDLMAMGPLSIDWYADELHWIKSALK